MFSRHSLAIMQLAPALFDARHDASKIFDALATCLTASLCDGCAIVVEPGPRPISPVFRHGAESCSELEVVTTAIEAPATQTFETSEAALGSVPVYAAYIAKFGLHGLVVRPLAGRTLLRGIVVATRDRGSRPFNDDELAAIETCIEFATLDVESALELETEREAMRDERERTAQFQQEMLGIVGHGLRSPVEAILMSTEILAKGHDDDPAARQAIDRIVSFANRMTRMVDQLLDLTRARLGGEIALSCSSMRLLPVLESVIGSLSNTHPDSRFELVGGELKGNWDSDRISQLLGNVLGNAVQFGRAGATIHVGVTHSDAATRIAIHNEIREEPMSVATLATIFQPYRRGWDHEHIGTGLGLGLYIAHEIVRAHHGTIAAESSLAGTTFHITLPDTLLS